MFQRHQTQDGKCFEVRCENTISQRIFSSSNSCTMRTSIPVSKGQKFIVVYDGTGDDPHLYFVYANTN